MCAKRNKPSTIAIRFRQQVAFAGIGIVIIILGGSTLAGQQLHYSNWWGGAVFAPFALAVGLSAVVVAVVARRKQ